MQVRISHQPMRVRISHLYCSCNFGAKSPLFYRLHMRSFLLYFFDVNSFLILVISQSQALLCKDCKRGGNHLSKKLLYILHLVKFSSWEKNTKLSLLSFSLFYFLFLGSQTTSEDVFPEDARLNLWFLGVKEAR